MADEMSRLEWYEPDPGAVCVRDGAPADTEMVLHGLDTGRFIAAAHLCWDCATTLDAMGTDPVEEARN